MPDYSAWIGRSEHLADNVSPTSLAGLAATLDDAAAPWPSDEAPPLFHWLHFLQPAKQSMIGVDGHPKRGGFLPPIELPRRMWAGSRLKFAAPVSRTARLGRVSTILAIRTKNGASGPLVFVTIRHVVTADGVPAVIEEQDIVYRGDGPGIAPPATAAAEAEIPDFARTIIPDPVLLFRFSALTFNSHRIHYDRDYARDREGYPGLVVHGPLLATLLVNHAIRHAKGRRPSAFAFTARRPLFDSKPFDLCMIDRDIDARLWTRNCEGEPTMTATLEWKE